MLQRSIAPSFKNATEFDFNLPPVDTFVLTNGIVVYHIVGDVENAVQMEWIFEAGNSFETKNGIAKAVCSLLKNGTAKKSSFVINEELEFLGSYFQMSCSNEVSKITLNCLSKYLLPSMKILVEMVLESNFDQKELEIYISNQTQKLAVNEQKTDFIASREIEAMIYGKDHPYGRYSTSDTLSQLTAVDLLAFHNSNYTQGKSIIFLAGKLPIGWQEEMNHTVGAISSLKPYVPERYFAENVSIEKNATLPKRSLINVKEKSVQASIRLARPIFNRYHPNFVGIQLLNTVFGGFFGSRLMTNIREEKGYTYGIHSYLQNHHKENAWIISSDIGLEVVEPTLQEIYLEMDTLRKEIMDADELQLVKNYVLGSLLGDLDGAFQIINRWKSYILSAKDASDFYSAVQKIKNMEAEELQFLAAEYLDPNQFIELIVQ